ncbi:MAG: Sjogren's syndrome/scleroderma autoantigen 1 family protein [Nitrososphaerota archaeon]
MSADSNDYVRRMSDALRSGAKMLSEVCPVCSSPLFQLGEELWCLKCGRRVVKVKEETEALAASTPYVLTHLEGVIAAKIDELASLLSKTVDPTEVTSLTQTIDRLLATLHRSRRLGAEFSQ